MPLRPALGTFPRSPSWFPTLVGLEVPKRPVLGGVGGNPWISVLFRSGSGNPIGSQFLLGRCVQLSQ